MIIDRCMEPRSSRNCLNDTQNDETREGKEQEGEVLLIDGGEVSSS